MFVVCGVAHEPGQQALGPTRHITWISADLSELVIEFVLVACDGEHLIDLTVLICTQG